MRNRYILIGDLGLIVLAVFGAFALRFDWRFYEYRPEFLTFVAASLLVNPPIFYAFGLYERCWRYASIAELKEMVTAVAVSSIILAVGVALVLWWRPAVQFSRAVLLINALLTLLLTGGLRFGVRVHAEPGRRATRVQTVRSDKRVLIVGAGDGGVMVLRELQRNRQLGLTPVGFLDDDPIKRGKRIHGAVVFGGLGQLVPVARDLSVDEVLIAMPTAAGSVLRALVEACRQAGLPSRTVPGVFELLGGDVSVSRLRRVEIADLLRRLPIQGEPDTSTYVKDQVVLVTGAGGSIGSELCRQVAAANPRRLVMLGHGENSLFEACLRLREDLPHVVPDVIVADIRDRDRLQHVFSQLRPTIVFHAAAHKHVPLMEDNPDEAVSNNILGTRNVVDVSVASGVRRLVMISTDKAVSPSNLMGASKRVAERIVRAAAKRHGLAFVVVRFGNVLGSRGSVVPLFKGQIERGGPVTVTHPDMRRFFMTIPEAVHLILQAGGIGNGGEVFVLDMGVAVRIVDLARDLIALSGSDVADVPVVFTGIRPGEKLEEALWEPDAVVEATSRRSILKVTEAELCADAEVSAMVESLVRALETRRRLDIEAQLAHWVPSYVPAISFGTPVDR
jgi:FlaA1/EpsC-like NDP-sugar epimerase